MAYESFISAYEYERRHITIDCVISGIAITIYIGAMTWFIYSYIKEYT